MFQVLVESRAPRTTRGSWTALSTLGHAALIAAAVALTARQKDLTPEAPDVEVIRYAPVAPTSPAPRATIPLDVAIPLALQRPSISIPNALAPNTINLGDVFNRVTDDLRRATSGLPIGAHEPSLASGDVHTAADVDRIVAPLTGNASPAYPRQLAAAGIEGDVTVRFVVDTAGRVEFSSIEIVQASHALFGDAVRAWLKQTRYSPALLSGRPVRQLVQQRVGFSLER